jgi:hypothetical protein
LKAIEEGANLLLIGQFYVDFQHFCFQKELLSHQNIMMANISEKVMEVKTSKLGRMNQVIILFVK